MTNHREISEAITDVAGIDDGGKTAEAFTRFFHRGAKTGWNSLTQDDFAPLEDAIADAYGRPRRKRKNNLVWKIGFWWHWHIADPLQGAQIHAGWWIRRTLRKASVIGQLGDAVVAAERLGRREVRHRIAWAETHGIEFERAGIAITRFVWFKFETTMAVAAYRVVFDVPPAETGGDQQPG